MSQNGTRFGRVTHMQVHRPPLKRNLAVIRQFEKLFGAVKHDVRQFSTEKSGKKTTD